MGVHNTASSGVDLMHSAVDPEGSGLRVTLTPHNTALQKAHSHQHALWKQTSGTMNLLHFKLQSVTSDLTANSVV